MQFRPLDDFLPEDGLVAVAAFKAELENGNFTDWHYLDIHKRMHTLLMSYRHHLETKGMTDINYFVLLVLNAIGVKIPREYTI